MEWPEGSESGLQKIHDVLEVYAERIDLVRDRLLAAGGELDSSLRGETAEPTVDYLRRTLPEHLDQQSSLARELASKAQDAAADIQKNKIIFVAMTALTLATVISLIASLFGAFMVPAVLAAARVGITALLRELIKQIAQNVVKQLSRVPQAIKAGGWQAGAKVAGSQAWRIAKYPAIGAAVGAGVMGGLDAGIQFFQKDVLHNRDNINTDSIKGMMIGGAIGGAASGFAAGAVRGLAKSVDDVIINLNRNIGRTNKLRGPDEQIPEKKLTRGQVAFGRAADGALQIVSVAASNPLVYLASGDKGGVASDGMFGAFARGGLGGGTNTGDSALLNGSPETRTGPGALTISGPEALRIPGPDSASATGGGESKVGGKPGGYGEVADGGRAAVDGTSSGGASASGVNTAGASGIEQRASAAVEPPSYESVMADPPPYAAVVRQDATGTGQVAGTSGSARAGQEAGGSSGGSRGDAAERNRGAETHQEGAYRDVSSGGAKIGAVFAHPDEAASRSAVGAPVTRGVHGTGTDGPRSAADAPGTRAVNPSGGSRASGDDAGAPGSTSAADGAGSGHAGAVPGGVPSAAPAVEAGAAVTSQSPAPARASTGTSGTESSGTPSGRAEVSGRGASPSVGGTVSRGPAPLAQAAEPAAHSLDDGRPRTSADGRTAAGEPVAHSLRAEIAEAVPARDSRVDGRTAAHDAPPAGGAGFADPARSAEPAAPPRSDSRAGGARAESIRVEGGQRQAPDTSVPPESRAVPESGAIAEFLAAPEESRAPESHGSQDSHRLSGEPSTRDESVRSSELDRSGQSHDAAPPAAREQHGRTDGPAGRRPEQSALDSTATPQPLAAHHAGSGGPSAPVARSTRGSAAPDAVPAAQPDAIARPGGAEQPNARSHRHRGEPTHQHDGQQAPGNRSLPATTSRDAAVPGRGAERAPARPEAVVRPDTESSAPARTGASPDGGATAHLDVPPPSRYDVSANRYGVPAVAQNPFRTQDPHGYQGYPGGGYPSAPARSGNEPEPLPGGAERNDWSPFEVEPRDWEAFRDSIAETRRGRVAGIHFSELAAFREPEVDLRTAIADAAARRTDAPAPALDSRFGVRRVAHGGDHVAEVTLRVALSAGRDVDEGTLEAVWASAVEGVHGLLNEPRAEFRNGPTGDRLFVRLERVEPGEDADVPVVVGAGHEGLSTVRQWRSDIRPREAVHEILHVLGVPDEHNAGTGPQVQLNVPGSLMGDFHSEVEAGVAAEGLAQGGIRPRYLDLLGAAIGEDVPVAVFSADAPGAVRGGASTAPASEVKAERAGPRAGDVRASRALGEQRPEAPQPSMPRRPNQPVSLRGAVRLPDGGRGDVTFTANDVETHVLRDASGRPAGICFPSDPGDVDMFAAFVESFNNRVTRTLPGEMGIYPDAALRADSQVAPPWNGEVDRRGRQRPPVFVFVHTNNERYGVRVPVNGTSTLVSVNQDTVAYLLDRNQDSAHVLSNNEKSPLVFVACDAGSGENSTRIVSGLRSGYSSGHALSRKYDNSLYFGINEVTVTRVGHIGVAENGGWMYYGRGSTRPRVDRSTIYPAAEVSKILRERAAADVLADGMAQLSVADYGNAYGSAGVGSGYGGTYSGSVVREFPVPPADQAAEWIWDETAQGYPSQNPYQTSYDSHATYAAPDYDDTGGTGYEALDPAPNPFPTQDPYPDQDPYGSYYHR
ncbi:hypothetical protein ACL03H_00755 [Saccharopolyspora sp. MS10]|uniref:WXG100-like domain-containing protein n=1 Tax=Saccharopolyspora sp. MS10 TaxID=3385973 RepID=UPI0039A1FF26